MKTLKFIGASVTDNDLGFEERREKLKQLFKKTRWIQLVGLGFALGFGVFFILNLYALTITLTLGILNLALTLLIFTKLFGKTSFGFPLFSKRTKPATHNKQLENYACQECKSTGRRHFKTCSKAKNYKGAKTEGRKQIV